MDLWETFGMSEGIAELCQELGISAGTAIVVLIALYFVIKWAVKNGMMEAYKKIEEKRAQDELKAEKTDRDPV
jgi:Tfp pilus assembly major pilin PilA